jgi:hypothetical protein
MKGKQKAFSGMTGLKRLRFTMARGSWLLVKRLGYLGSRIKINNPCGGTYSGENEHETTNSNLPSHLTEQ